MPARPGEVSVRKAAAILEVHPRTIRRWCIENRVPHRRTYVGRIWLEKAVIEKLITDRRIFGDPEGRF